MCKDDTTIHWLDGAFIIIGANLEDFCEKYGLEPFDVECNEDGCTETFHINIPFRSKDRAGLCSERCKCGTNNTPFSISMSTEAFDRGESLI